MRQVSDGKHLCYVMYRHVIVSKYGKCQLNGLTMRILDSDKTVNRVKPVKSVATVGLIG